MTLSETLKQTTLQAHRHAESRDLQRQLVRGSLDEQQLISYLGQLYRVHVQLECLFDQCQGTARLIQWSETYHHSRRLDQDLTALGMAASQVNLLPATERLQQVITAMAAEQPLSLLGFFYVLEGSMNGNSYIVRTLRQSAAASRCSFTYFDPYGHEQRAQWSAFKAVLDAAVLDEQQRRIVVNAACCMFEAISEISDEVLGAIQLTSAPS